MHPGSSKRTRDGSHPTARSRPEVANAGVKAPALPTERIVRTKKSLNVTPLARPPSPDARKTSTIADPRPGLTTPVHRALRSVLERDVPPPSAPGPTPKSRASTIPFPTSSPPRSSHQTKPKEPRLDQRSPRSSGSDARFIPDLGWCIRRAGWTDSDINTPSRDRKGAALPGSGLSMGHGDDNDEEGARPRTIVYHILFLDGMRMEIDAGRTRARLTDQHGMTTNK